MLNETETESVEQNWVKVETPVESWRRLLLPSTGLTKRLFKSVPDFKRSYR